LAGVYDNIVQDARLGLINEGAAFYRKCGADCMVVVGGGSVMDTAKAINIMIGGVRHAPLIPGICLTGKIVIIRHDIVHRVNPDWFDRFDIGIGREGADHLFK